jgi:hypothetical protein
LIRVRPPAEREEVLMAAEVSKQDDMPAHEKSFALFASMMKWGTILSFLVGLFVVIMISN